MNGRSKQLLLALGASLGLGACGDSYNRMATDQVCRDTGYAIAARTLDCEGDADLAERRYQAFLRNYDCQVSDVEVDPVDVYYHCVAQISKASCAKIQRFGDSLRRYLTLSPTCAQFLAGPGLTQVEEAPAPTAPAPSEPATADGGADAENLQ